MGRFLKKKGESDNSSQIQDNPPPSGSIGNTDGKSIAGAERRADEEKPVPEGEKSDLEKDRVRTAKAPAQVGGNGQGTRGTQSGTRLANNEKEQERARREHAREVFNIHMEAMRYLESR